MHTSEVRYVGSTGATGFALTALCIGAERGWISRRAARRRAQAALRSYAAGPAANIHGWFYHFVDIRSGARYRTSEVSTSDSTWLVAGALTARQYFQEDPQIARFATGIYERVNYRWMLNQHPFFLAHGWTPESGFLPYRYDKYCQLACADAWPDGFREVLDQAMGGSDDRWLEVACALLASLGIPQPTIDQLMANPNWPGTGNQAAAWALKKGAKRGYPNRLIRCMLRNMPTYEWGATNRLLEFKDSPLVIHELTISLTKDPSGSIYAAYMLVRNGQRAFLTEALKAAVQLASNPGLVPMNRLQASSALLRDYGTDDQFDIIPATLRRLQNVNEDQYRKLFGSVSYRQNKRELRVAAILIDDRRPGFGNLRYCDVAAATVEKLSGENFGIKQEMTASERDRAVALAAAWLRSHRTTI